mmetsp:Transcript_13257/g.28123  ORF Transcript_13257/g.28123 Transcript_13257/m.28123 type:complete len:517 (-) Transcript_13257:907-2457(-)
MKSITTRRSPFQSHEIGGINISATMKSEEAYPRPCTRKRRRRRRRPTIIGDDVSFLHVHVPYHVPARRLHVRLSLLLMLLSLAATLTCSRAMPYSHSSSASASSSAARLDPYDILGVPRTADQAEIRRKYRKLCLRYHPDKNVDRSETERKRCEEAFKTVQRANELIGDEAARNRYDSGGRTYPPFGDAAGRGSGYYGGSTPSAEDIYGSFFGGRRGYYGASSSSPYGGGNYYYSSGGAARRRRRAFYVNGIDVSDFFRSPPINVPFFSGHPAAADFTGEDVPKSIFVEKVIIPLQDLYSGVDSKILQVHDSIWNRYRAAFRGGIAGKLALQAALSAVPLLLRTSLPVAAFAFVLCFHIGLPRPERLIFPTAIRRGWKTGTKIKYHSSAEIGFCDVVFVVEEGKHSSYVRDGNNLKTTVTISSEDATNGCTIHVEPLAAATELPITINLRPGEVQEGGCVKTLKGKGWPGKRGRGDLLVAIDVVKDGNGTSEKESSTRSKGRFGKANASHRKRRQR